ncbi:scavenger receptor cysteine-rich type 1 protein M130 [Larimichthys crocea]|uniref:scavenger receptor cysteine-rich type 1 protein M130 n=1 Tax=Larimichthys crocea TaxID=215358 RepID=UPI000F5E2796|nr:scavenger receptor cysteine-rich type 1 protein M130 [Larimichthys crocea]
MKGCSSPGSSSFVLDLSCSDSVRLVNGNSLCSGRLEVKSDHSNQLWSSVCEDDFDQQDADVVCRELGCGAPSVLQGALYGEVEAALWTKEFQCGGHESALLDCRRSGSTRSTCSPGKAVGLTCSEPVRLVGGNSRCAGTLELKQGGWRPMGHFTFYWTLKKAAVVCRDLDCGSVVSVGQSQESSDRSVWLLRTTCVHSRFSLRDCVTPDFSSSTLNVTCSDSVRLVNGNSLCSGRLEVKSDHSNQLWSSVCEADFDQQDADVVCRELGCGAPSVLQGALYGEVEAALWTKVFQCGGHESALLDCRRSGSTRNTCSPGKAVGLTCSEPVRLVGGNSRCAGTLEVKQGDWRLVIYSSWTLKDAAVVCRDLKCGSAVYVVQRKESSDRFGWSISSDCVQSGSALRECLELEFDSSMLDLTCSDSVRMVNGNSLCSGRLEVKSDHSNQLWSSVCEADFDQQDADVVCRELGCGAPSVLQGALYGEVEAALWTKEFQCGGHESALLDCRRSGSTRNTCSPGKAVGLTCSEPVRLVGGNSRCAGRLEIKHLGDWKPVRYIRYDWTLEKIAVVCRDLGCGPLSVRQRKKSLHSVSMWTINSVCIKSESALKDCVTSGFSIFILYLTCSDQLVHPNISVSSSMDGVSKVQQQGFHVLWGSSFTISCSIQPQYPGGSFQLTFTSTNTAHNYTQPAVNHSAHFLFPVAEPTHQGSYSCVYHVYIVSRNFSSESHRLCLTGSGRKTSSADIMSLYVRACFPKQHCK